MNTFIIGSKGMVKAETTPTFKLGEPVSSRQGYFYYVVDDKFDERAMGQLAIRYDEHKNSYSAVHANPQFGFYSRAADWPIIGQEEITALVDGIKKQRQEEREEREKSEQIRRENIERGKAWILNNKPESAVAVIVAELREADHDPYNPSSICVKRVVLAWSHKKRDDFSEMRAAAALYPPTASLANYDKDKEQREKYSGGAGFYLGDFSYGGWKIKKHSLKYFGALYELAGMGEEYFVPMQAKQDNSLDLDGTGNLFAEEEPSGEVTIILNDALSGIEIVFKTKPGADVIAKIKGHGFRWHKVKKLWYAKQSSSRIAFANSLK